MAQMLSHRYVVVRPVALFDPLSIIFQRRQRMLIRKFRPGEESELWHLFHDSVHHISTELYTSEQLTAWSPHQIDADKWRARIRSIAPFVVEHERKLIGYADVQTNGYLDHFFVHHQWQRRGVGNLLMQIIVEVARQDDIEKLFSD